MRTKKKWSLTVVSLGLIALVLVGAMTLVPAYAQGPGNMMGQTGCEQGQPGGFGPGWMMGPQQNFSGPMPFQRGLMGDCSAGFGDMMAMMGLMMHGNMMGRHGLMSNTSPFFTPDPLTLAEASTAVEKYLAGLNDDSLELGEVMVFDNHAYAQIVEKETGIGVMEVLVDPATKAVYPEMGPNMMWNLKYGMMAGFGGNPIMGSGMMHGGGRSPGNMMGQAETPEISGEMSVTAEEAVEIAQAYLEAYVGNDLVADEHADPFYGYYTLHVERDGETIGMLSVNGFSRQVFLHTWHGDLLVMSGE